MPQVHELKCWPEYYEATERGDKGFEIRKNDRNYKVGDHILLKEYMPATHGFPGAYTGRTMLREITYLLPGGEFGLLPGYVVISYREVAN